MVFGVKVVKGREGVLFLFLWLCRFVELRVWWVGFGFVIVCSWGIGVRDGVVIG